MIKPVQVRTAVFWYADAAAYDELQTTMDECEQFQNYETWLKNANNWVAAAAVRGEWVSKIQVVPKKFLAWCKKKKLRSHSSTRALYATERLRLAE